MVFDKSNPQTLDMANAIPSAPLVTVVSYCSIESAYGDEVVSNARRFSDLVIVSLGTRLYSGEPEDVEGIRAKLVAGVYADAISSLCPVNVITYDVNDTLMRTPIVLHNLAREAGIKAARGALGARTAFWTLFLDGDEVPEGDRVREWWRSPAGDKVRSDPRTVHKMANYWLFLHPRLVADAIEDSVLLVHSDALVNPESLKHPRERDGIYLWHLTSQDGWRDLKVERRVAPVDGKPLFWHYSWVRPSKMGADGKPDGGRAALKAKVANWGHKDDTVWSAMIDRAFDRIEEGCWPDRDFVHGYTLKLLD